MVRNIKVNSIKQEEEENLLKEGYIEMFEDLIELNKEWEGAESKWAKY